MEPIDVLIVGGGPAGLATAVRLKDRLARDGHDASVVVLDKAAHAGEHNLSGAVFETACLDELVPGWRDVRAPLTDHLVPIDRDELYLLLGDSAIRIPSFAVPRPMRHTGDVAISISKLVAFLARQAEERGVERFQGYAARRLLVEDGTVRGIRLAEVGLDPQGRPKPNHRAGEEIRARLTILADGSHGTLTSQFQAVFGAGRRPEHYSLGVKAVVRFPDGNPVGAGRVVHTLGAPLPGRVFGGGFIYGLGPDSAAVGLILGLDWPYGDLDPRREFERYKTHPFVAHLLAGGVTVATGAKTIPEGGFFSIGRLVAPGALVVGDAAGFVNMEKIKGLHYAILSGMCAADTVAEALATDDPTGSMLRSYRTRLARRGILRELRHARNYRQAFRWGLFPGLALSQVQHLLPGRLPMPEDRAATRRGVRLRRPDPGGMDPATFVSLTGALHREDEPSHVRLVDPARCASCLDEFDAACTHFCPGDVYRWRDGRITLSPSNCLHCMTCTVKCPSENIEWVVPEGGEGPRYKQL